MNEDIWIVVVGVLVFFAGVLGLKNYKRVNRVMFGEGGPGAGVLANGPAEFLILPMLGAIGIGALFVAVGIARLS